MEAELRARGRGRRGCHIGFEVEEEYLQRARLKGTIPRTARAGTLWLSDSQPKQLQRGGTSAQRHPPPALWTGSHHSLGRTTANESMYCYSRSTYVLLGSRSPLLVQVPSLEGFHSRHSLQRGTLRLLKQPILTEELSFRFPKPAAPTAKAKSAKSIPSTKSHNTKPERYIHSTSLPSSSSASHAVSVSTSIHPCLAIQYNVTDTIPVHSHRHPQSPKESAATTANNPATVVRRSPSFTKRQRRRRRLC